MFTKGTQTVISRQQPKVAAAALGRRTILGIFVERDTQPEVHLTAGNPHLFEDHP
jgi:hypothetical protein